VEPVVAHPTVDMGSSHRDFECGVWVHESTMAESIVGNAEIPTLPLLSGVFFY